MGLGSVIDDLEEDVQLNLCRAPAYPYRKLIDTDIRLLRILPGQGRIECILHQMPLVKEQMFYALSYVWGNGREKREIILEDRPFQVTKNLYEALQQLREKPEWPVKIGEPDDYFWVDAICLNQEDFEEKSHQIPRMMEIYHSALKVVIWLGPNKPMTKLERLGKRAVSSSTDPVELLRLGGTSTDSIVGLLFEKAESLWTDWELPDDESEEESVLRDVFGESYGAVLRASAELLQRPWFKRVWTVQECSLEANSSVLAGRCGVYLDRLIKLLKVFGSHHRLILLTPGFTRIHALDRIGKKWSQHNGYTHRGLELKTKTAECVLEILSYVNTAQATDPRDQIYGLLSLVTYFIERNLPAELKPDYRLPFEVVYWHYAAFLIEYSGDLRLLSVGQCNLQGVPSWVPDFRSLMLRRRKVSCGSALRISEDKRLLYLKGIRMKPICDQIGGWYDPRMYPDGIQPGLQHRIRYVEGRIFKLASQIRGNTLEEVLDDFLWIPNQLFDQGGINGMRRAYTNLRGHSSRNGAWISKKGRAKTMDAFGKDFAIADYFHHSLVLLEDGTICISKTATEIVPGDLICIFKGAAQPSLIRPSEEANSFTLLSHCDIRYGTFFREPFNEEFWTGKELEEFQLI
ncbi:heterokaryon incompatibility protein-domain-containing protein [Xylariaceae sp. FL1651]|nr:heterokaryon incompatibility protein-domain-containing protein [Xylariaceae sp. FL1651]